MQWRRFVRGAILCAVIIVPGFAAATPSQANTPVGSSYTGWGYVTRGAVSGPAHATAWKWTSTGWQQGSWENGTSFWAHPYADGWTWAFREGAWYALREDRAARWSCTAASRKLTVTAKLAVTRYNASGSQVLGYVGPGTSVTVRCASPFTDASTASDLATCAAIGCGPDKFLLVDAVPMPGCMYPDPGQPMCMLMPPPGGFPVQRGYLRVPEAIYWQP